MTIGEALNQIVNLPYLAISTDCALEEAAEKITRMPHIRGIYVVDEQGRLQGYLSLGVLIRNVVASRDKPHFTARSLLAQITSKKVAHIMDSHVIYAQENDDLEKVVDRMAHRNIKQIPVLDEGWRIIANVGILDLWKLLER
jgi:CBS domain-containing protein